MSVAWRLLLPLSSRFLVWLFVSAAALIGATLLTTRLWPGEGGGAAAQRRLLLIAAGPLAVWVLYLGQVDTVQLLAWVLGLRWMERGRYRLAGAIVVLGLMKPWVLAGPFLLLAVLARRRGRLRAYLSGALAGLAIALLVTLPVGGPAMWRSWAMFIATASVTRETDIASITGLAVTWLPAGIVHALAVCWIVAWAAVCALALRRMACAQAGERQWLLCGATAWLVISPFAHSYDSLPLIVPALWLVWSRDERRGRGERWTGSLPWCVWWVCGVASIIPAAVVPGIRGWGALPLLVATVALWRNPAVAPPVAGVSPSGAALGGGAPDGDTPPNGPLVACDQWPI